VDALGEALEVVLDAEEGLGEVLGVVLGAIICIFLLDPLMISPFWKFLDPSSWSSRMEALPCIQDGCCRKVQRECEVKSNDESQLNMEQE
jgi:hypothetical protein